MIGRLQVVKPDIILAADGIAN